MAIDVLPAKTRRGRGTALIVLSALFFSTSGTLGKPTMVAGLTPQQVAAVRLGLSALVLFAAVGLVKPSILKVGKGEWRLLIAYGLVAVGGIQLVYFIATSRIPVGIAILLEFVSPVLIALWTRFVRKIHLAKAVWGGIALAMVGLVLVAQVWQGLKLDALGLLAGFGAALCSAGYFLIGERGLASRHPLGMVTWGMGIGALAVCVVAPPWTIPARILSVPAVIGPWHPPVWVALIALALVGTVLAYLAGISALQYLPAAIASVLGLVEVILANVLAWILLGEALTVVQAVGAVVLLGGATIVQLKSPDHQVVASEPLPG
ncbi:DMT family transporter [Amycolatopsis sp. NPDC059657]|uniref:EamA family transporter n=1 Tax=Amycolatopsis sp. NPDC059657 TaxID=3346899 RepID=UPI00366F0877